MIYGRKLVIKKGGSRRQYLVCERMKGDGCDYTIGCGMNYKVVTVEGGKDETEDVRELQEKMAYPEGRDEYCAYEGDEFEIEEALIVPYKDVHVIDVKAFADEIEAREREEELAKKEEADKAEYKRLKAKFG